MGGNWLHALCATDFISLVKENGGEKISRILTNEYIATFKKEPSLSERMSWKNSLPALAEVLKTANLTDQIVLLEYFLPSRDKMPCRVDAVICGVDAQEKVHAVLIELKQWSHDISKSRQKDCLLVQISGVWKVKMHPRKQVEGYRAHMKKVLNICKEEPESIIFSVYAYLHNAFYLSPELKHLLFGKGDFDPDSKLYTKDFSFALANRLRESVGAGKGDIAFNAFKNLQMLAVQNAKLLPKRPNYKWHKVWKAMIDAAKKIFINILKFVLFLSIPALLITGLLWLAFTMA